MKQKTKGNYTAKPFMLVCMSVFVITISDNLFKLHAPEWRGVFWICLITLAVCLIAAFIQYKHNQ